MIGFIMLLTAIALIFSEAWYESKHGDKNHALSLFLSVIFYLGVGVLLKADFLSSSLYYIAARVWFDVIFNYLRGNKWNYLGNNATDRMLKNFNPMFVYFGRFLTYALCIFFAIEEGGTFWQVLTILLAFSYAAGVMLSQNLTDKKL